LFADGKLTVTYTIFFCTDKVGGLAVLSDIRPL